MFFSLLHNYLYLAPIFDVFIIHLQWWKRQRSKGKLLEKARLNLNFKPLLHRCRHRHHLSIHLRAKLQAAFAAGAAAAATCPCSRRVTSRLMTAAAANSLLDAGIRRSPLRPDSISSPVLTCFPARDKISLGAGEGWRRSSRWIIHQTTFSNILWFPVELQGARRSVATSQVGRWRQLIAQAWANCGPIGAKCNPFMFLILPTKPKPMM